MRRVLPLACVMGLLLWACDSDSGDDDTSTTTGTTSGASAGTASGSASGTGSAAGGHGGSTGGGGGDGTNWWETVLEPTEANTGPQCTGRAGCPTASYSGPPTGAGNLASLSDGGTLTQAMCDAQGTSQCSGSSPGQNCCWENFTFETTDVITIAADGVTFRNFKWNQNTYRTFYPGGSDFLMEYGEMLRVGSVCSELITGSGFAMRFMKLHNCDDIFKFGGGDDEGDTLIEDSILYDLEGGHGDTFHFQPPGAGDAANITIRHNAAEGGNSALLYFSAGVTGQVLAEENWFYRADEEGGWATRCTSIGPPQIVRNNLWQDSTTWYGPVTNPGCDWYGNLWMDTFEEIPYSP